MSEARVITEEEARIEFLYHLKVMAQYWAELEGKTDLEKCEGVVFSILTALDGCAGGLPAYDLLLSPHDDDKRFSIDNGMDYYEKGMMINDCQLHDLFCNLTGNKGG